MYRLILESEGKKYDKTDPWPSSPVVNFLAQNKLLFIKVSHVNFEVARHFCETPGVTCVAIEICETSPRLFSNMNKGGKFLRKLWCCVGGEYNRIIWFYQLG